MRIVQTAADVTPAVLADAEEVFDGWFADDPTIDWEDFIDRLAGQASSYDFESY